MDHQCGTCYRKITDSNALWQDGPSDANTRDSKKWCGGCTIGVRYISYPAVTEYFDSNGPSRLVFRKKPESVPSKQPWTTWSGTMLCAADSELGLKLKQMDPNYEEGYIFVDKDHKVMMPGTIRGLYTANN